MPSPKLLITSDLHLTAHPKDAYRWQLFPWLKKAILKHKITDLCILGDLTDQKDKHPAKLVNQIVDSLVELAELAKVHVLMGNHDYMDANCPFMKFLDHYQGINYFSKVTKCYLSKFVSVLFLPHTRQPEVDWKHVEMGDERVVLMHQTMTGAQASNGMKMEGLDNRLLGFVDSKATVISGDIHVPQKVGRVVYCGSPYTVHFGDTFRGRVLIWEKGKELRSLQVPGVRKLHWILEHPDGVAYSGGEPGDIVRVTLHLKRSEFGSFEDYRKQIAEMLEERELVLEGVALKEHVLKKDKTKTKHLKTSSRSLPLTVLAEFCKARGIEKAMMEEGAGLFDEI